jgi:uncharacterized protein
MTISRLSTLILSFMAVGWMTWFWWDRHPIQDPIVRTWTVTNTDLPALRIAVLGDFHFKQASDLTQLSRVKRQLIAQDPDLILFVGDYINSPRHAHSPDAFIVVQALDALAFPDSAFAVLGNHEHIDGAQRWREAFEESKIQLLENSVVPITLNERTLCIRGLGDLYSDAWEHTAIPEECGERVITMTHDPAGLIVDRIELDSLSVAGHTHCGQIQLPLIGNPFVPTTAPPEMHCGLYQRGHYGLTTGGLGTSVIPIRWGAGTEAGWDLLLINSTRD